MTEIENELIVEKVEVNSKKEVGLVWLNKNSKKEELEAPSGYKIPEDSKVHPVISRESLIPLLVDIVNSSREVICVSSFLLQGSEFTESLLKASERGVRVYILTAGENDLKVTDEDGSPSSQRVKEFRQLLSTLSDKVFLRTADFHAKFVLIDPEGEYPNGVMTTCNLTTDAMSGHNKELFVTLSEEEVYSFFCQFTKGVWEMSRHELIGGTLHELEENSYKPENPIPNPAHPATLISINSLYKAVRELITSARKSVDISAWTFSDEVDVPDLLMECLNRNVSVKIYARPNYLNGIVLSKLKARGAIVLGHDRFHAKTIVVDGEKSIVTTANFAKHGLEDGFEAGVLLGKKDTMHLSAILKQWEAGCNWELSMGSGIESLSRKVKIVDEEIKDIREVEIADEKVIDMPVLKLGKIMKGEELQMQEHTQESKGKVIYKKFIYRYRVMQPTLPEDTKKVENAKEKFDVFTKGKTKKLFIPISQWEELEDAREIAERLNANVVKYSKSELSKK